MNPPLTSSMEKLLQRQLQFPAPRQKMRHRGMCQIADRSSATTLLPRQDNQDNLAPSWPSEHSWFVVSCGVRLSEVGFLGFRKPRSCGIHKSPETDTP